MDLAFPKFTQYLYFLFVPTLVYRPTYPRTAEIHWKFVFVNFAQVLGCLLYTNFLFERFCLPLLRTAPSQVDGPRTLLLIVIQAMLPATMVFLLAFFAVLHSWLNAWAEMLRFADRQVNIYI